MRLEGQSKLGYYPTPPEIAKLIREYLVFPKGKFYALDPCCGEGTALNIIVEGTRCETYGVELDKGRAEESKNKLDHVINDAIENVVISEGKFSLLFLNPPYDRDESGDRKEKIFLALTTKYLMPGGILVYIIPYTRIYTVWDVLSTNYKEIIRLDFPEGYIDQYRQTVFIAIKRDYPTWGRGDNFVDFKDLGEPTPYKYNIPVHRGNISTFTSMKTLDIDSIFTKAVWESFNRTIEETQVSYSSPILPLREGHISILLACGYLDGQVGSHVAKGTVITDVISTNDGEKIKEKTILKASVKILDKKGNIKILS